MVKNLFPWLVAFAVISPALQHLFPFIQKLPIVKIAFAFAWIGALVFYRDRMTAWLKSGSMVPVVLLLLCAWFLFSAIWSDSPGDTVIQWLRLAASASTIVLFAAFDTGQKGFKKAGKLVFYTGVAVASLAVFQVVMSLAGHTFWLTKADGSIAYHFTSWQIPRATVGFYHPNNLGLFLFCCLTWLIVVRQKEKTGLGENVGILLLLAGAFCSGSKTSMGLMLLIIIWFFVQRKIGESLGNYRSSLNVAGFVAIFALVPVIMFTGYNVKNIRPYPLPSNLQRALLWDAAAQQSAQNPLLGAGYGLSAKEVTKGRTCALPIVSARVDQLPHNFLVQSLLAGGFIGAVFAALFFTAILIDARKKSSIVLIVAVAWLVAASLHNLAYQKPFWIAIGLLAVAGWKEGQEKRKGAFGFHSKRFRMLIATVMVCLILGIAATVLSPVFITNKKPTVQYCSTLTLQGPENKRFESIHQFGLALLSQNKTAGKFFQPWPLLQGKGLQTPTMQMVVYNDLAFAVADIRTSNPIQSKMAEKTLELIVQRANEWERLKEKELRIELKTGDRENLPERSNRLFYILWVLAGISGVVALHLSNDLKRDRHGEKIKD